eukprot:jgi/Mesvir1/14816/Mv05449-RA.1
MASTLIVCPAPCRLTKQSPALARSLQRLSALSEVCPRVCARLIVTPKCGRDGVRCSIFPCAASLISLEFLSGGYATRHVGPVLLNKDFLSPQASSGAFAGLIGQGHGGAGFLVPPYSVTDTILPMPEHMHEPKEVPTPNRVPEPDQVPEPDTLPSPELPRKPVEVPIPEEVPTPNEIPPGEDPGTPPIEVPSRPPGPTEFPMPGGGEFPSPSPMEVPLTPGSPTPSQVPSAPPKKIPTIGMM